MITKLAWMVASGRDNPCMNALKSKYKVQHGWINSEPPKVASSMWRAIERLKPSVSKGACFIIGDGKSVDYWKNPWIPWLTNFLPKPKSSLVSTQPTLVVSLINSNNRSWNLELLEELFDIESVNAIGRINLPLRPIPDKLAWIVDSKGAFSVKSAYKLNLSHTWPTDPEPCWKALWKCKIHERLKTLVWRIGSNSLSTNLNVFSKLSKGSPLCPLCGDDVELVLICSSNVVSPKCFGLEPVGGLELTCYRC
jgi:hypothetical protein